MRNTFARTVLEMARRDERVVVLVADISPAGAMNDFGREFPTRFVNVGVAEQTMIGVAAGLAQRGFRPFCYTIATFALFRPYEFVRCDLAYQDLPVTVVGMGAGLSYSTLGGTHQAVEDVAVAMACPNLTVLAPADPYEVEQCTRWCVRRTPPDPVGPVYLRLGKSGEPNLPATEPWTFARARWVRSATPRPDALVLTYGPIGSEALVVAERLGADLVTIGTLRPLPPDLESLVRQYARVVVIEEASGAPLASALRAYGSNESFALPRDFPHIYGSRTDLLQWAGLTAEAILSRLGGD